MTNQCCGLAVIFGGFISHLIGRETINIPEIFSGVHGFTGKTINLHHGYYTTIMTSRSLFRHNPVSRGTNQFVQ